MQNWLPPGFFGTGEPALCRLAADFLLRSVKICLVVPSSNLPLYLFTLAPSHLATNLTNVELALGWKNAHFELATITSHSAAFTIIESAGKGQA